MGNEKQEKELMKSDGSASFISPTVSLATSDSNVSSFSDYSIDTAAYSRAYQERSYDNGHEDPNLNSKGHSSAHVNGFHVSDVFLEGNIVESSNIIPREAESLGNENVQERENGVERAILSVNDEAAHLSSNGIDSHLWLPPEPEDIEDDVEGSVANFDDDDDEDYGDGMKWGKPSSLSSFGEEGRGSYRFKEEKKKAMDEVMNGKFKTLVGQLLKSVRISCTGNGSDNWVDKVTSLSWEAASFVKPDAFEGKAMDPDGYVKVKCIATGSRSQSEVFKGLVFKKHAAHKHMPTNCKKPKLLLIKGALSVSSNGLSSFEAMQQDQRDSIRDSIIGMIEKCHPDVVLVEKTVSRDIQESILQKKITLVLEMKLHRLERVARCTDSLILSSDELNDQKLRHCDSFHFERIVEELAVIPEGGKMPSKTLMFLEGCPKRLGCTILLKGSHSEELKRIKYVVQFAVVMAYHLILESSFLFDLRAMFSIISLDGLQNLLLGDKLSVDSVDASTPLVEEVSSETNMPSSVNIPISNGIHEDVFHDLGVEGDSVLSFEPYNPVVFSGLSHLSASLKKAVGNRFSFFPRQYMPHFGFNEEDQHDQTQTSNQQVMSSAEVISHSDMETKSSSDEDKALTNEQMQLSSTCESFLEEENADGNCEGNTQRQDDISTVLNSESILILMSSRNSSRGTMCEQSHFSCIRFYRNFDVPLGKFLKDNLLNQKLLCGTCGQPPEAHLYYYAHHNKQLTVQVKHLDKRLPGESDGKLWMWSCCGKCKRSNGNSNSTKRVLISSDARGLSFGKFLELGFSSRPLFGGASSCGHSFHSDFLYFFGLGSMVAMLRYTTVEKYAVSLPCQELTFSNVVRGDFIREDIENVYKEGISMFLEVENSLKDMGSRFVGSLLNIQGSFKEFSDVENMLKQERHLFEVDMQGTRDDGNLNDDWVYKPLHLNVVHWDLLLESCVWDQRLYSLLSSDLIVTARTITDEAHEKEADETQLVDDEGFKNAVDLKVNPDVSLESNDPTTVKEIPIEGHTERSSAGDINSDRLFSSTQMAMGRIVPITGDVASDLKGNPFSVSSKQDDPKGWMWTPFPDIRQGYMNDLQSGYLPKFEHLNNYSPESRIHQLISEEGTRLHFPLGKKDYIVTDYEDELSSIIACALTLLTNLQSPTQDISDDTKSYEVGSQKLPRSTSSILSSFTSLDSDGIYSAHNIFSEEPHSVEGLEMFDSVIYLGTPHPLVSMGRLAGKSKYSVACLYASQFLHLRKQCGLSEAEYIASLSRCENWDAKGGKSKAVFAKTLDDRFIIKEIKKTEFHSFMAFASDFFKYMNQCFELGNQTCLAKILGIYQVRKRKSGIRHDLMVMENLTYGRQSISRQYDLKGALHARFTTAADGSGDVLLDQNFVNDMNVSPLYVNRRAKRKLQRAVWNDTAFLNSINVMDYSLLVGVDSQKRELVCGIIDYLRQYTLDKQLESWVKSSLVPKNQSPTVISPVEYKKRFRKFIDTHFLSVPDDWCSQRSSNPCSLCGPGEAGGNKGKEQGEQANKMV